MDKLSAMITFVRVVESGSFSAVAEESNSTQGWISKQVSALEAVLGAKLLIRTTRALSLTESGERYFEQARRLIAEIAEAESELIKGEGRLHGMIRVAASVGYGRKVLIPIIDRFLADNKDLKIDLNLNDGFIDIVEQGIDVAIRIGELADSSLLSKRVGTSLRALVAGKRYLKKIKGKIDIPKTPSDLERHSCIIYTGAHSKGVWEFNTSDGSTESVHIKGNFQSNSSEAIREAVLSGLGLYYAPTWLFIDEIKSGEVVVLLDKWPMQSMPINAVYPSQRKNSAKVRGFIEHLITNSV